MTIKIPQAPPKRNKYLTFDIECFYNYFLCTFVDIATGDVIDEVELWNNNIVNSKHTSEYVTALITNNTLISFNGNKYDILILSAFMAGKLNVELKVMTNDIINNRVMPWVFETKYQVKLLSHLNHIDLIEPAFGVASLKVYGARLEFPRLQEIPTPINTIVTLHHRSNLKSYCINDNDVTFKLYECLRPAIDLRVTMGDIYGFDMRSLSDAQIGERVMVSECKRLTKIELKKADLKNYPLSFIYKAPSWISFTSDKLQNQLTLVESLIYNINPITGKTIVPDELGIVPFWGEGCECEGSTIDATLIRDTKRISDLNKQYKGVLAKDKPIEIKDELKNLKLSNKTLKIRRAEILTKQYNFQIGGVHSQNDSGTYYANSTYEIFEIDVGSFYPWIILNAGYFISQMGGDNFRKVYGSLVDQRMKAKERVNEIQTMLLDDECDNRESLTSEMEADKIIIATVKIVLNGFYGKLSSHYSKVYAPNLLVSVTLTGQLAIMMLLEKLHEKGLRVLSANTDGINVRIKTADRAWVDNMVNEWCVSTGFTMDYNHYNMIGYRDVNNYFYQHADGYMHGIGIFAGDSIRKSPDRAICRDAIFAWVKNNIDVETTIHNTSSIHPFMTLKKASGGCNKDGVDLGGTVRWYRSTSTNTPILNNKSGNIVAGSTNGMPCLDIPDDLPTDIDYDYYIDETYRLMAFVGMLTDELTYLTSDDDDDEGWVDRTPFCEIDLDGLVVISKEEFMIRIGVTSANVKKYNIPFNTVDTLGHYA